MHQKSSHFFNPIAFSSPYTRYALIIIRFLITLRNISLHFFQKFVKQKIDFLANGRIFVFSWHKMI